MASFECTSCSKTFETLGKHSYHQRVHANEKNFLFTCGVEACSQQFGTYGALNTHLHRCHNDFKTVEVPQPGNLQCSVDTCTSLFACDKDLCYHILREHNRKGEAVKCPLSEKCHSESLLVNFQSHLSKYHRGWNTINSGPLESALNLDNADFEDSLSERRTEDAPPINNPTFDQDSDQDPEVTFAEEEHHNKQDVIHNLAKFYLRMESEFILPESTVQAMSEGLSGLQEQNLLLIKARLMHELQSLDLEPDVLSGIVNRVMYADALYSAHDKSIAPGPWLSTNALRKAYYKKYFRYIAPVENDLSFDRPDPTFVYYVPVEESLKIMLECPSVQKEVDKSFQRTPSENIIRDYYDGLVYLQRKRERPEKTIDLFIFQDAFKPTNDASPVASKHSTLGVYFSLGNLDPRHRTDLDSIQLLMVLPKYKKLFKDDVLRKRCFEVLVEDLKKLETDGIAYKGQKYPVNLVFLIGDNLGQHEIGGFIGSFSAEYFCRYCPITRTKYAEEPWATEPFRTKEEYEEDMQTATRLHEEDPDRVHYRGVKPDKFKCPFNALENFHVCDPALAPCIAHDILSGVLAQDLPVIINHFVEEGWVSYPRLNGLLENLKLKGTDANNKPSGIPFNGTTLSGNAVQNWTLLRLLPFIFKKKKIKNTKDPYWLLYLSLKEICEYLFAPSHLLDQVAYLKSAIENYQSDRAILGFRRPKGHFLGHLADLIILLGPLILLWTLRFEGIHSFFRSVSRASHNFVNPGKTMTNKHCLYLAYMSAGTFFQDGIIDPKVSGKLNYESFLEAETANVLLEQNFSDAAEILESVVVNGIKYKRDKWTGWLLLGNLDEVNIHIGKICCIVCDKNQITILLKTYIGRLLNEYGIYEISNTVLKQVCVSPLNLKSPCLQTVYSFGGRKCFSLKHTLSHDSDYFD